MTPAFCTGSRVYGEPRADSDLDLVVLVESDETVELLAAMDETRKGTGEPSAGSERPSFRFGALNLIVCRTVSDYYLWRAGTADLALIKPVARDTAKAHFLMLEQRPSKARSIEVVFPTEGLL